MFAFGRIRELFHYELDEVGVKLCLVLDDPNAAVVLDIRVLHGFDRVLAGDEDVACVGLRKRIRIKGKVIAQSHVLADDVVSGKHIEEAIGRGNAGRSKYLGFFFGDAVRNVLD